MTKPEDNVTDEQLSAVLQIMDETGHENYALAYPRKPGDDMVMLFSDGNVTIKADGTVEQD